MRVLLCQKHFLFSPKIPADEQEVAGLLMFAVMVSSRWVWYLLRRREKWPTQWAGVARSCDQSLRWTSIRMLRDIYQTGFSPN